jgi:hypothetical protein
MREELLQRIETYANARRSEDIKLQQFATAHLMELINAVVIYAANDPVLDKLKTPEQLAEEQAAKELKEKTVAPSSNGRGKVAA